MSINFSALREILYYRGKAYYLDISPRFPYLENQVLNKKNNIEIDDDCSEFFTDLKFIRESELLNRRTWILENNKLYLKDFICNESQMLKIFKTEEPVLADWFSDDIMIDISSYLYENDKDFSSQKIILNIEKGIVKNRLIVKSEYNKKIRISSKKYNGVCFNDLIYGKIKYNSEEIIKKYIKCIISFLTDINFPNYVNLPLMDFERLNLRAFKIKEFLVSEKFVAFSPINASYSENDAEELSNKIEQLLKSDFKEMTFLRWAKHENSSFAQESLLLNPDLDYLIKLIKTDDAFFVYPKFLSGEFTLEYLRTFKTKRLNNTIFEYEPIFETVNYKFSKEILEINLKKFESEYGVFYDYDNDYSIVNLKDIDLYSKVSFFIDENSPEFNYNNLSESSINNISELQNEIKRTEEENESTELDDFEEDHDHSFEKDKHYFSDGWEDIDPFYDAFEGDIDAWNHYNQ